jgi:hypothetical protein
VVQLLVAFLLIGLFVFAVKVAILMIFLVGIIWRPKETISLIVVLGAFALLRNYPGPVVGGLGLLALVAAIRAANSKRAPAAEILEDKSDS